MSSNTVIAKGSAWSFTGQAASKFFSFVYTVIIAHILIPDEIGSFYLALSIVNIIFIFTDFGIYHSMVRYIPFLYGKKEFGKLHYLTRLGYFGGGSLTLLFSLAVFLFSSNIADLVNAQEITPALQVLSVFLLFKEIFFISKGILRGRKRIRDYHLLEMMQNLFKMALAIPVIYLIGFTSFSLSVGFLLSFAVVLPLGLYWVHKETKRWPSGTGMIKKKDFIGEVAQYGIIISIVAVIWNFIMYSDRIMLGYFEIPLSGIGIYSVVFGLATLVAIFPISINSISQPLVAELYGGKKNEDMKSAIATTFNWTLMVTLPITIVLAVFSDYLLGIIYGAEYVAGSLVLSLIAVGMFLHFAFIVCRMTLNAMGKLIVQIKSAAFAGILNIVLNMFLIPGYGINGAAFASMASMGLFSACLFYYSKKEFGFRLPGKSRRIILVGILTFLIMFIVKNPFLDIMDFIVEIMDGFLTSDAFIWSIIEKILKLVIFGLLFLLSSLILFFLFFICNAFGSSEIELLEKSMKRINIPEEYSDRILSVFKR